MKELLLLLSLMFVINEPLEVTTINGTQETITNLITINVATNWKNSTVIIKEDSRIVYEGGEGRISYFTSFLVVKNHFCHMEITGKGANGISTLKYRFNYEEDTFFILFSEDKPFPIIDFKIRDLEANYIYLIPLFFIIFTSLIMLNRLSKIDSRSTKFSKGKTNHTKDDKEKEDLLYGDYPKK